MNSDSLRQTKFEGQSVNDIYRDKDDSGGSEFCEDYEEEAQETQESQKVKNELMEAVIQSAREKAEYAAYQLKALIAGH